MGVFGAVVSQFSYYQCGPAPKQTNAIAKLLHACLGDVVGEHGVVHEVDAEGEGVERGPPPGGQELLDQPALSWLVLLFYGKGGQNNNMDVGVCGIITARTHACTHLVVPAQDGQAAEAQRPGRAEERDDGRLGGRGPAGAALGAPGSEVAGDDVG